MGAVLLSEQIFDAGYAIPVYDICTKTQIFRYRDDQYTVPFMSIRTTEFMGIPVAPVDIVREKASSMV